MKKLLLLLVMGTCNSKQEATQGSPEQLDIQNGFSGVQFGSSPDSIKGRLLGQTGSFATYEVEEPNRPSQVSPLVYYTYRAGRLIDIDYTVVGAHVQPYLVEMRRQYGPETTSNDTLYWRGETVAAKGYIDTEVIAEPILLISLRKHK